MKNFQFPLFVGTCLLATVQAFVCSPSMFVELSTGKYYFSPIKASWPKSWQFCRLLGANLVSIETVEEQQVLVNYIKTRTGLVNLALNKAASQSSMYGSSYGPSYAVDGAGLGCTCTQDCSRTALEDTPWWQVDLGNDYKVSVVSLANRVTFQGFLRDFEIRVGDKPAPNHGSNILCGSHVGGGIAGNALYNVTCDPGPIIGRYVTVQITEGSENQLMLCEVQVLGETANQTTKPTTPDGRPLVSYWTSGIKISKDENWMWMSTGNPIEYTSWCDKQPDNNGDIENCLHLNFKERGCWNDFNCSGDNHNHQEFRFICEVDKIIR